jgi:hypothetical protein
VVVLLLAFVFLTRLGVVALLLLPLVVVLVVVLLLLVVERGLIVRVLVTVPDLMTFDLVVVVVLDAAED